MIFDYIALNKSNTKVEGEITAESVEDARERLHNMGLTVLAVNSRKEEIEVKTEGDNNTEVKTEKVDVKKDYLSFEFKGIDPKGKEIVGTIDAKDALAAYIRLKKEFLFDVKYIFDLAADESEREKQKTELAADLQKKYELAGLNQEEKDIQENEDELAEIEQANAKKLEILRGQVGVMIAQIQSALSKVKDEAEKRNEISQIKTLIAELERVKMSNNIKHIKGVAERILDIAETLFKGQEEYKVVIQQKEDIKSLDLEKIEQMQQKQAAEIRTVASVLDKASEFFKKYIGKIGIDLEKKTKKVEKKALEKELEGTDQLITEIDLTKKTKSELKADLKANFKTIFSKKTKAEKRAAWLNLKNLLKAYFEKRKIKEEGEEGKESKNFLQKLFGDRKMDLSKKDYQHVFIEINHFLGWLICFYVVYFVVGGLVLQKNLAFLKTFFYRTVFSEFLLILLFILFIFHLLTNIKIKFLRQSFLGAFGLFTVGVFTILLYTLNF